MGDIAVQCMAKIGDTAWVLVAVSTFNSPSYMRSETLAQTGMLMGVIAFMACLLVLLIMAKALRVLSWVASSLKAQGGGSRATLLAQEYEHLTRCGLVYAEIDDVAQQFLDLTARSEAVESMKDNFLRCVISLPHVRARSLD